MCTALACYAMLCYAAAAVVQSEVLTAGQSLLGSRTIVVPIVSRWLTLSSSRCSHYDGYTNILQRARTNCESTEVVSVSSTYIIVPDVQ